MIALERELEFRVNGVHTARVVVPMTDPAAAEFIPGVAKLKVYRERTDAELSLDPTLTRELIFYGSLPPQNVREDAAAGTVEAVFCDPRWVLAQRYTTGLESYTDTDQGDILWGLVDTQNARAGGDTALVQGSTTTGVTRTTHYDRRRVSDAFDEMVRFIDGPDVDVTPDDSLDGVMGLFNVYARQGEDRPNATFTYGKEIGSNCRNVRREYREAVTEATIIGTGTDGAHVESTYSYASVSPYGLLEHYASLPDASSQEFAEFYARGVVEALKTPREVVTVEGPTAEAPQPFIDYELGDTVYVSCRKGVIQFADRPLRVHGIRMSVTLNGTPEVTLTTAEL